MNDETTIVQSTSLPKGFGRTPTYKTAQQLVDRLILINKIENACLEACEYQRGKELVAAKEQLPHSEYLQALSVMHISSQDASRLRSWYEACQSPGIREFDTAKAEQKLSKHAREEFCRADDDTKAIIAVAVSDDVTTKITAKQIKAVASAPDDVRQAVISCNEPSIQAVRNLINDDYEIDISGQSKEELGEMLKAHSAEVNGLRFQCTMNDGALEREMKDFGSFNSEGYWYQHKPLTIIKKLIPQLTPDEKRQLIDSLSPTIDV